MSALFDPHATYCFNCGARLCPGAEAFAIFGPGTETCRACVDESAAARTCIGKAGESRKRENADILTAMRLLDDEVERVTETEVEA